MFTSFLHYKDTNYIETNKENSKIFQRNIYVKQHIKNTRKYL